MPKVYMRAANAITFEWVARPEYATSYDQGEMELLVKRFEGAVLERAPASNSLPGQRWIISKEA